MMNRTNSVSDEVVQPNVIVEKFWGNDLYFTGLSVTHQR